MRITEAAQSEDGRVESELRQAQTASLKLSESLANLKGQSESARRDADASMRALKQLEGEHQRLLAEQEENTAFFEKAQPIQTSWSVLCRKLPPIWN